MKVCRGGVEDTGAVYDSNDWTCERREEWLGDRFKLAVFQLDTDPLVHELNRNK